MKLLLAEALLALSSLKKAPGFVITVVLTLAITLGALITTFSIAYLLFVKALPYDNYEQLNLIEVALADKGKQVFAGGHAYPGAVDIYKSKNNLDTVALIHFEEQIASSVGGQPLINATYVTPEYFQLGSVKMELGRALNAQEGLDSRTPAAVISYQTWLQSFAGREDILNQKIVVAEVSYPIVGVTAKDWMEPQVYQRGRLSQVWLPWDFNSRAEKQSENWGSFTHSIQVIGALKAQSKASLVSEELSVVLNRQFQDAIATIPSFRNHDLKVNLRSLEQVIVGDSRATALLMLAGALALVLIACANVANVFLARAAEKQRQYAIQAALGASPRHLFITVFVESGVLMLAATLLAVGLAVYSQSLLAEYAQKQLPRIAELSLNGATVIFSLLVGVLLALSFASLITRMISYKALNSMLQSSGKGSGLQISKTVRNNLILSQVTLASVVLIANFSILKGSLDIIDKPTGFVSQDRYYLNMNTGPESLNRDQRIQLIDELKAAFKRLPQVSQVSNSLFSPMMAVNWNSVLMSDKAGSDRRSSNTNLIDQHFFSMLQIPMLEGRNFSEQEVRDGAHLLVINKTLAKALGKDSADKSVLGKKLYWQNNEEPYTVIGVVDDINLPGIVTTNQIYLTDFADPIFLIETLPGQSLDKQTLLDVISKINGSLRIFAFDSLQSEYRDLLARNIFISVVTLTLALITALLAGIGIYGVLSYNIKLRRYEFGVRMALGASPALLTKLIFKDSAIPVLVGILIGSIAFVGAYFGFSQHVGGYISLEALPIVISLCLIGLVSLLACALPTAKLVFQQPIKAFG